MRLILRRNAALGVALLAALTLTVALVVPRDDPGPVVRTVPMPHNLLSPVLDTRSGRAFIGDLDRGDARVFDTRTGALLRTVAFASPPRMTGLQIVDAEGIGRVIVFSGPAGGPLPSIDHVRILDARDGRALSDTPVTLGGFENYLAVDAWARRVFLLGFPPTAYAPSGRPSSSLLTTVRFVVLDATNGRVVRTLALPLRHVDLGNGSFGLHSGPPLVVDERASRVYVSAFDRDGVYSIDAPSGRVVGTLTLPVPAARPTALYRWSSLFLDDHPRRLVAVGGDAQSGTTLTTIDTARWRVLWSVRVDPFAVPSIDATTRRIFVANATANSITLLDATTGRPLRTLPGPVISTPFTTYPIVVDERSGHALLVNLGTGVIDVLDGVSGRLLRTTTTGPNLAGVALDRGDGRLFVTSLGLVNRARQLVGAGRLWIVDAGTGAVLRTLPVGAAPFAVALNTRVKRALVLSSGGVPVAAPDPWGWAPPWLRHALPFLSQRTPATRVAPPSMTVIDTSRL